MSANIIEMGKMLIIVAIMAKTTHGVRSMLVGTTHDVQTQTMVKATQTPSQEPADIDPSVHSDGVYDLDHQCLRRKQSPARNPLGFIVLLAMSDTRQ